MKISTDWTFIYLSIVSETGQIALKRHVDLRGLIARDVTWMQQMTSKSKLIPRKITLCSQWDWKGAVPSQLLQPGQTIDCNLSSKRNWEKARPHTSCITWQTKIDRAWLESSLTEVATSCPVLWPIRLLFLSLFAVLP